MKYINQNHIREIGIDWSSIFNVIKDSLQSFHEKDFAQPVKPYLRFNNLKNRIIAMPAYVGGAIRKAGIKWIASFPGNIQKAIPRAHSVTILNDSDNGKPVCIINTNLISGIRTIAVSGMLMDLYLKGKKTKAVIGISGIGPIGRLHVEMITSIFQDSVSRILIYDIREIDKTIFPPSFADRIFVCSSWQEAYVDADIFITCTVSEKPYIDVAPKKGSLQMNVSLRDYETTCRSFMDYIIVDDWDEVCRENTDIERMYKESGLTSGDTVSLAKVLAEGAIERMTMEEKTIMFNPMGMAIFDVAVGNWFYTRATQLKIGIDLED